IDRVVGLEIGADDYVMKPFSPRELVARVKAILRRTKNRFEGEEETIDESLPFDIDTERFTIHYQGRGLKLTRYEFKILEIFIRRPGRIYTREMLMDQVWEEPDASMERTVDAHIKSIRSKLRAVRDDLDPIVTHRGLGYSLREDW
ncbi:MAG: winged helix-turn-helix domain-containing protein, partial [Verrucomicrobiota bacterium]